MARDLDAAVGRLEMELAAATVDVAVQVVLGRLAVEDLEVGRDAAVGRAGGDRGLDVVRHLEGDVAVGGLEGHVPTPIHLL
jgi:hypothetical protein